MIIGRTLLAAACFCTLATAALALKPPTTVLAKPGVNYDARAADMARCTQAGRHARLEDLPPLEDPTPFPETPYPYNTGQGGIAAPIAMLIVGGIQAAEDIERQRAQAAVHCMVYLGYTKLPLTPEEEAVYNDLSSRERDAWEQKFLATDLSARIAPLTETKVPPLPAYRSEPMTTGGLKIDAASVTVPVEEIESKGIAVSAHALRWRTATLVTPIALDDDDIGKITADAGTVFHQVDYRPELEPLLRKPEPVWCGLMKQAKDGAETTALYCITARRAGYYIEQTLGPAWFAGPPDEHRSYGFYKNPIQLEERAQDDLGPLDVSVVVQDLTRNSVKLAAVLAHGGEKVTLWTRKVTFDGKGRATLPFWNMRVLFKHSERNAVTVTLDQAGDGRGWADD